MGRATYLVVGRSGLRVELVSADDVVSAGTVLGSVGDEGLDVVSCFSGTLAAGDAGAKSSSKPPRSLSESDSSSRSSSEMGGNSLWKFEKPLLASALGPAAGLFAFLKLANADSKSSLAFASSAGAAPKREFAPPLLVGLVSVGDVGGLLDVSAEEPEAALWPDFGPSPGDARPVCVSSAADST